MDLFGIFDDDAHDCMWRNQTRVLPYGCFLTRVIKDVSVNLIKDMNFEASSTYDTYDDQSMGIMKFEKALNGFWVRKA